MDSKQDKPSSPAGPKGPPVSPAAAQGSVQPRASGARSLRVLIIEDERDVVDMLQEMLDCEGHTTVAAPDGQQGLARFRSQPFDIVITDMAMPGMTGWDVAREIKKMGPTPVVLLTGWDVELDTGELNARGIDRFIKKPFALDAVLQACADLCSAP